MRTSAFIRIIIYLVVAVICISLLLVGLLKGTIGGMRGLDMSILNLGRYGDDEGYEISSNGQIYTTGNTTIDSIYVDWVSGRVTIEEYDGQEIRFYEENNSNDPDLAMRFAVSNGSLRIKFSRSGNINLGLFNLIKNVVVQVPKDYSLSILNLNAVSSPVNVTNLNSKKLSIETTSGAVTVYNVNAERINVNTVSGQIDLNRVKADSIDIGSVSGRQYLKGECVSLTSNTVSGAVSVVCETMLSNARFDSVSGQIELYLPENKGFTANWDTVSGRFSCDFMSKQDRNSVVYGDGSADIRIHTVSGKISINAI
ncbi:MAG: DUF4097 domain-containing protein [Oscillospiraceae bacterium]|nr:DUF4097 domain-containing protein [Oscillospiraceae bacterium]